MKVFYCTDHDLHWPVGGGSVVVAKDADSARRLLDMELGSVGLEDYFNNSYTLIELDLAVEQAVIISDGNY